MSVLKIHTDLILVAEVLIFCFNKIMFSCCAALCSPHATALYGSHYRFLYMPFTSDITPFRFVYKNVKSKIKQNYILAFDLAVR